MKMKNGMYLFAAAIVAGTVGLSSCSNDEDVVGGGEASGVAQKVTLGVSVNGVSKKAAQGEVNLGGAVADIANVLIVPVAGGQYQVPISFGTVNGSSKQSKVMDASLQTTVNEFLVYGNVWKIRQGFCFARLVSIRLLCKKNGCMGACTFYMLYVYKTKKD